MRRLAVAAFFVLVFAHPVLAEMDLAGALGRPVLRLDVQNRSRVPDAEIRGLFLLRPGDRYDASAVERSLLLLGQKVEIRNVIVHGEAENDGIALRLVVEPEPLIRTIRFEGNRALKDKALSGRLRTRVDRPAVAPLLEADARATRETYAEEGFPDAHVEPRVEETGNPLWLNVTFHVKEGEPLRIRRVELGDGEDLDRDRILSILGMEVGSVSSQRKLREGVRKLLDVYHKEGYLEARVSKPRFQREDRGSVLILPLVLGEPLELRFEGIDEWSARPLKEVAASHFGEPVDGEWADRVAEAMADHLKSEGYRDAEVTADLGQGFEGRRLTFHVVTGPVVRVKKVVFEGNRSFRSKHLQGYMSLVVGGIFRRPPFTQEALDRDVRVLSEFFASQGFLDAQVDVANVSVSAAGKATVRIRIREGAPYRLGQVAFECGDALGSQEAGAVSEVSTGDRADPAAVDKGRVKLLAELHRRGFLDARVDYRTEKHPEAATVDVRYCIEGGTPLRVGKVVVSGNARTRTGVIRRELTLHDGDLWNEQEEILSRQNIYRLGHFQRVNIGPLASDPSSSLRDMRVGVEEQNAGSVTFGVGYGTEEGPKGFFEVGHSNLQGAGRSASVRAEPLGKDKVYSVSYREPWLFGYHNDLGLRLLREETDREAFDLFKVQFQASLDRKFTERIKGSLLYTLESVRLDNIVDSAEAEKIDKYLLSAVGPLAVWDDRDDPFNPKRGYQATFLAEWASDVIGSELLYGKYLGSLSGFFTRYKVTLALLARAGLYDVLGSSPKIPIDKRFFLGGRTSVRGFEADEISPKDPVTGEGIGGDVMVNTRAEARFPIWQQLGGLFFWDSGNVWNRREGGARWFDLRHGAGGGIRYITPVGPISFDMGWKVDRKQGEDPQVWYFTIGNVF